MRILGSTQYSRDEDRFHSGTHSIKQWDECPRCGILKYAEAKLCSDCSIESRAVRRKAKYLVGRLMGKKKFVIFLAEQDE